MDSFTRLLDTCARALSRYENVHCEGALVAAVSGGIDSTMLLVALKHLADEGRLGQRLCVAHIDHDVRPDSAANAQHVVDLCDRLDVPVLVRKLEWPAGRRPSEDELRNARYRELQACAHHFGAGIVATGHHADDNLETVLFRMMRGTGPRGLAGIPDARWLSHAQPRVLLVRPLLRTRRVTLQSVLERMQIEAYEDPSNEDLSFTRNRLRHETIPTLRKGMGIGLDVSIMTVASTARAANEIIEAQGLRILSERARNKTSWRLDLDLRELDGDSMPFVREALRQAYLTMHAHGEAPSSAWLDRAVDLLHLDDGKRVAGRGGLMLERTRTGLLLVDTDRTGLPPRTHDGGQRLDLDGGRQRFGATEWSIEAHSHPLPPLVPSPSEAGPLRALLDPRTCAGPWRLRTRRPGDRFQPLGCPESVDLRRFLQRRHLPRYDRNRLPLLVDADDRILWVPGVEISDLARLHLNTRRCVEVLVTVGDQPA